MLRNLSVGKGSLGVSCERQIAWFVEATKQMFVDFADAIHEYKSFSNKKKKTVRKKALWLAGYVMIHAIFTAVGCMASAFGFILLLCCSRTDFVTPEFIGVCIIWLDGLMLTFYGVSGFDWEAISYARKKRNARVKMRHLKNKHFVSADL